MDTNRLPLTLKRRINEQPPSVRLPLTLGRKLGEIDSTHSVIPPTPPVTPVKRRMNTIMSYHGSVSGSADVVMSNQVASTGVLISKHHQAKYSNVQAVQMSYDMAVMNFYALSWANHTNKGQAVLLATKYLHQSRHIQSFKGKQSIATCHGVGILSYQAIKNSAKTFLNNAQNIFNGSLKHLKNSNIHQAVGHLVANSSTPTVTHSVPVPCRYYPIPEPAPIATDKACRLPPPSKRLPLSLRRKSHQRLGLSGASLPLYLSCWHDDEPAITPNLRSYIVHNVITATVGGLNVSPLSFNIKTDMDSFCWQGQIELSAKDFAKVRNKVEVDKGKEALISVVINGTAFVILAEEVSKTRQFVAHTYQLSGRSVTAHLSADYAKGVSEAINNSLYASQLVNHALAFLPFSCEFLIGDWLIPSGQYATSDKTPIAILGDVAEAAGAFVTSDKSDGKLSIKPRYKVPAWQLSGSKPDVIVPLDVIKSLSEQRQVKPRFNSIVLTGNQEGAIVYRQREDRGKEAPSMDNALYTDQVCMIASGIATLSDSGTHMSATIVMRWADKYGLSLANLGDIWQINDKYDDGTDNTWVAVVVSVALDVRVSDGVPTVWQTVGLDRYLDV